MDHGNSSADVLPGLARRRTCRQRRNQHLQRVAASASRRHDIQSATSVLLSATSNPNDGDGYACGDADGPSPLAPSEPPSLLQARYSSRSWQNRQQQRRSQAGYLSGRCGDSLLAQCLLLHIDHGIAYRRHQIAASSRRPGESKVIFDHRVGPNRYLTSIG